MNSVRSFEWRGDHLALLDQRRLPLVESWVECRTWRQVEEGIRDMIVRGAPAIGIAAAYGLVLGQPEFELAVAGLRASRPTAVNLFWAIDQMVNAHETGIDLLEKAQWIERHEAEMSANIGAHGAALVPEGARIMTICNTGSLATAGIGTALGIIRTAHAQGKVKHVYACETRPRMQGLRLTAYELQRDGIEFSVIVEGAAATLFRKGEIDFVVAGADRIAANGDTANKIGTCMLAMLAAQAGVPMVIAAPSSTLDPTIPHGDAIPIEERDPTEITEIEGQRVAPLDCPVWNPAFDVTPGELLHAIVTEEGVHRPPFAWNIR